MSNDILIPDCYVCGDAGEDCAACSPCEGPDNDDFDEEWNATAAKNAVNIWLKHSTYQNDTALAVLLIVHGDKARVEINNYFNRIPF